MSERPNQLRNFLLAFAVHALLFVLACFLFVQSLVLLSWVLGID